MNLLFKRKEWKGPWDVHVFMKEMGKIKQLLEADFLVWFLHLMTLLEEKDCAINEAMNVVRLRQK